MTHRFNVGDRVVIVRPVAAHLFGAVATVLSDLTANWNPFSAAHLWPDGMLLHELDIPSRCVSGVNIAYPPDRLVPYRPDDREPVEWSEELRRLCGGRVEA